MDRDEDLKMVESWELAGTDAEPWLPLLHKNGRALAHQSGLMMDPPSTRPF